MAYHPRGERAELSPSAVDRRAFLCGCGVAAALSAWPRLAAAFPTLFEDTLLNPCLPPALPERLARHEIVRAAWDGMDPTRVWDCHVHLVGTGDSGQGPWLNPAMSSLRHPIEYARDPTRRQILQELKSRELAAGEIAGRFPISGPSISRHLAILEGAGLVSQRRDANRIFYRLEPESLASALGDFLSAICPTQIARRRRAARGGKR